MFCVSSKDKMNRLFDPRENRIIAEWSPHNGTKCSKMTWTGEHPRIITTGFNRSSQREWKMWDLRNLAKPISHDALDQSSGTLLPFFDPDTNMLYLAGKGDGNIRYYEVMESSLYPLLSCRQGRWQYSLLRGDGVLALPALPVLLHRLRAGSFHVSPFL